jgi:nucleoid-associated protein YgaU
VKKGDTLSALAKRFYGKGSLYMKIFDANQDVLTNPDLIKVGQKLRVPK